MEFQDNRNRFMVPADVLVDVLHQAQRERIHVQFAGVLERRNLVLIELEYDPNNPAHEKVGNRIAEIIEEYKKLMDGILDDSLFLLQSNSL